jgi:hypothetical protein
MTSAETICEYLIQVFVPFAPGLPQLQPLLLRVPEDATVERAIELALARIIDPANGAVESVPSPTANHYALCHALGDGSLDPRMHAPLGISSVIRDAGLSFPYMLALTHVGESAKAAADRAPKAVDALANTPSAQLAADLSAAEREAATARLAEVEARRAENVRRIEEQRNQKDVLHFHQCESHELRRREDADARRAKQREEARVEAMRRAEEQATAAEAATRAERAQRAEVEAHRRRMIELQEAETARLDAARKAQAAHEAAAQEAKRRAAEQRRLELAATKDQRMSSALDSIVAHLDTSVQHGRAEEVSIAQSQFEARAEAARRAKHLREVQALEARRSEQHAAERDRRTLEAQVREERARLEQVRADEEKERKREDEEARFNAWRAQQQSRLSDVEGELELSYRIKKSPNASAASRA